MKDLYEVLGISKFASKEEIKKAYKKKSVEFHPDKLSGNTEQFKEVQEAYEILNDPVRRNIYDKQGHMNFRTRPKSPTRSKSQFYEDIATEFFGGSQIRGRNIQTRVEIDFSEVLTGCTKPIKINKKDRCPDCGGRGFSEYKDCVQCKGTGTVFFHEGHLNSSCNACFGTGKASVVSCKSCKGSGWSDQLVGKTLNVNIPAGILSGMQLRIPGEGEESTKSGICGDLIIFVIIKEHPIFIRENQNIIANVPVSYTQLIFGDTIDIPTLNQGFLKVKIPPGSSPGTKIRLQGKGFPGGSNGIGDLYCILRLDAPKDLSDDYKMVLEQLVELEKKYITPKREEWLKKVKS